MAKKRKKDRNVDEEVIEESQDVSITRPNVVSITKGYSRKLNLSAHGGKQFETLDISETRTATVGEDENADMIATKLYNQCRESVELNIKVYDSELEGVIPESKKEKKEEQKEDQEELEEISQFINQIVNAETAEDLKEVQKNIAEESSNLKSSQLEYLRNFFNKKAKALAKK